MARRLNDEQQDDDKELGSPTTTRRPSIWSSRYLVFGFLTFGVLVLTGSLVFTILSSKAAAPDPDDLWSMVRRSDWKAEPPKGVVTPTGPARYVVVGHTDTEDCSRRAQCLAVVHQIQARQQLHGFLDITDNFLVGGDGTVYEGRGWGVESARARAHKRPSFTVGLIGSFSWLAPSQDQLGATSQLIRLGVKHGYIADDYVLLADVDQGTTNFKKLLKELSTWPHWSGES